jgi:hypothetical protein
VDLEKVLYHLCYNRVIVTVVAPRYFAALPSSCCVEVWRSPSLFRSVQVQLICSVSTHASFYHALPVPVLYLTLVDMTRSLGTGQSRTLA